MRRTTLFGFAICIIIIALTLNSFTPELKPAIALSNPHTIDSIIDIYVNKSFYPFAYVRLEDKNGRVIYEHGIVNQQLFPGANVNGDSWMRIWSMSKIITISTVMNLVDNGIMKLNDPVTKYIPEFKNLKVAVNAEGKALAQLKNDEKGCPFHLVALDSVMTVLQLINHEAGFYYATTGIKCLDSLLAAQNLPSAANSQELINRMAKLPILQQPGTTYYYGTNTTVLGLVAERATGKSLKKLVEERITGPLGIKGLRYDLPEGKKLIPCATGKDTVLRLVRPGELNIFGGEVPDYSPGHQLFMGGEGMIATANGYTDFLRMLLQGGKLNGIRVLEESTVRDIHSPHTQLDNSYGYNGYNLWVSGDSLRAQGNGDSGLWIGGGYEGTHFWVDPKREFVGVIMTQMFWIQPGGYGYYDAIIGEIYKQLFASEKLKK